MAFDSEEVDTLMRMVRRRARAFGWEAEGTTSIVTEVLVSADRQGMSFNECECIVLEVMEEVFDSTENERP